MVPVGLLAAAAVIGDATPFSEGSFFFNDTGRFIYLRSVPTLGKLKQTEAVLVAGSSVLDTPVSECIWGSYKSVLFLGEPPRTCRRGKRLDGSVQNGAALVTVSGPDSVDVDVLYPAPTKPPYERVGPFKQCREAVELGKYVCDAEEFTAVEIYKNMSSVWIHDPGFLAQSTLFQFMGLIQAVLFAVMAAKAKNGVSRSNTVVALSADAAASGAFTQALLLGTGRSFVGLDTEVGFSTASRLEMAVTAWCASLAACAYVHASVYEMGVVFPRFGLDAYRIPFKSALRELCEIPLLVSLVVIWPENAGPHFLIQLQFMCGLAVSYISGRASGLVYHFSDSRRENIACAAFLLLGGIAAASVLCIGTVAASGAVIRGGPAVVCTVVLQMHVSAGGFVFGTASRLFQARNSQQTAPERFSNRNL